MCCTFYLKVRTLQTTSSKFIGKEQSIKKSKMVCQIWQPLKSNLSGSLSFSLEKRNKLSTRNENDKIFTSNRWTTSLGSRLSSSIFYMLLVRNIKYLAINSQSTNPCILRNGAIQGSLIRKWFTSFLHNVENRENFQFIGFQLLYRCQFSSP